MSLKLNPSPPRWLTTFPYQVTEYRQPQVDKYTHFPTPTMSDTDPQDVLHRLHRAFNRSYNPSMSIPELMLSGGKSEVVNTSMCREVTVRSAGCQLRSTSIQRLFQQQKTAGNVCIVQRKAPFVDIVNVINDYFIMLANPVKRLIDDDKPTKPSQVVLSRVERQQWTFFFLSASSLKLQSAHSKQTTATTHLSSSPKGQNPEFLVDMT